jgi:ADP-ribosylglycohydrolase
MTEDLSKVATPRPKADQFAGSIIGQCLGDAVGFPVEGQPRAVCARYAEIELDRQNPAPLGRTPFRFGQYTDDSQLARELMASLVEKGRFDPADYAERIALIFARDLVVGRGRATTDAAGRLARGVPWTESGTPPPSAGNGSAMRAAPIGLFFWDDAQQRVAAAGDQGRITHADPRCSAGAAAIAGATALALRPGSVDPDRFLEALAPEAAAWDPAFETHLGRLRAAIALDPEQAAPLIATLGMDPALADGWEGISPFVVGSVLWSLYAFLRSPDDYWGAIRTAIAAGGDVDTTAAMTGAISGARLGLQALPLPLAHRLNDQGTWPFGELVSLAHRLHRIATGR